MKNRYRLYEVFVGFQANGTLGRMLIDGAEKVTIFGEEIANLGFLQRLRVYYILKEFFLMDIHKYLI